MTLTHTLPLLTAFSVLASPLICRAQAPCPPSPLSVEGGSNTAAVPCSAGAMLAEKYPGDVGIANDPDVVWSENFEASSVAAVTSRYNDAKNPAGMSLVTDIPTKSRGRTSMRLIASGTGANATDLYKNLGTGYEELYTRYYVKYQAGAPWHHSGVWIGGYNPPANWPSPKAGLKPLGDDRFSVGFEPITRGNNVQLDFYNYWMTMHSWMAVPSGSTAYYGNTVLHDTTARAPDNTWICVEVHVKMNPDPASKAGAKLGVWLNDASLQQFSDAAPLGYWIRDKFCPATTTDQACTEYRSSSTPLVPLDLRFRSSSQLKLNYFWAQNYISEGGSGSLWFDDMVVAKRRIGCLR